MAEADPAPACPPETSLSNKELLDTEPDPGGRGLSEAAASARSAVKAPEPRDVSDYLRLIHDSRTDYLAL